MFHQLSPSSLSQSRGDGLCPLELWRSRDGSGAAAPVSLAPLILLLDDAGDAVSPLQALEAEAHVGHVTFRTDSKCGRRRTERKTYFIPGEGASERVGERKESERERCG